MKKLSLSIMTIVILGACHSATAQLVKTEYVGLSTQIAQVSPGKQWITGDRVFHTRDWLLLFFDQTSDPRLNGDDLISITANFKLAPPPVLFYGPMAGKAWITNAGGRWVGSWVGTRTALGHSFIRATMRGEGGYKGLQARVTYVRQTTDPTAPFVIKGEVIATPK